MSSKSIEILFLPGCPSVELVVARAREAVRASGVVADVSLVEVRDVEDAVSRRFLGSPSVRVNGTDVEEAAADRNDFGWQCRMYPSEGRLERAPPAAWIAAALREAPESASESSLEGDAEASVAVPSALVDVLVEQLRGVFSLEAAPVVASLVRQLAEGAPVSPADLARVSGRPLDEIDAFLASVPSLEYANGKIIGAGLTLRETAHAVEVDGRRLFTWCALDALVLPGILGKACRITSRCPVTGESVSVRVGPDRVEAIAPPAAVVSVVLTACCGSGPTSGDLRSSFCDRVRFFAAVAAAEKWSVEGGLVMMSVYQAHRLVRELARRLLPSGE